MATLMNIASALSDAEDDRDYPVDKWHPTNCGEMDLIIQSDGTWVHEGAPINRPQLVRLFSKVLRKDDDGYVLVTPAEKISITVEDVPFVIVEEDYADGILSVRTNVGDRVDVGTDHPLTVEANPEDEPIAYVKIRGGLKARFGRAAWYRLIDMADIDAKGRVTISSRGETYVLGETQ